MSKKLVLNTILGDVYCVKTKNGKYAFMLSSPENIFSYNHKQQAILYFSSIDRFYRKIYLGSISAEKDENYRRL